MNTLAFHGKAQSRLVPYRPAPYRPALGQAPAVSDALSPTMEKAYRDMSAREKYLTLAGYQWLAAMTTQGLKYGSEPYTPFFPVSTDSVFGFLDTAKTMLNALTAPVVALLGQFGVEMKAAPEAQRSATTVLSDLRNVRNRIIKDLVDADNVVELEYFGDLPGFPGEIVYRKVAKDKAALARPADLSALFADKDPATLLEDGLKLKEKYEEVGAPKTDVKYSMGGYQILIAGAIFLVIIGILAALFVVRYFQFKEMVFKRTMDDADKALASGKITPAQHAKIKKDAQDATDIFAQIFKGFGELPWTTIALVAGGAAVLIWGVPAFIQAFRSKPEPATT